MQTHITPNNRLASLGTIGLLFLAGIAGMVFLLPASPVHAATPSVSLSTISSGKLTAATSGTVGSTIVVTGTGFKPAAAIFITTTVGTSTVSWLSGAGGSGVSTTTPEVDSLVVGGLLTTTAIGNFQVEVLVPALPGGVQSITVSDGVNTGTASFTVTPAVTVTFAAANFGFPEEGVTPSIVVTGFGSGESVTVSTPMFSTASYSCTTGAAVGTFGSSPNCGAATTVIDQTSGAKTITATGATSGLVATTTYTVNPWAAFYNSGAHTTSFSFIGTAPTSIIVEAHGLPAAAIGANTITIGGVASNHAAVTPGTTGTIYGLVVSPSTNVPYGLVSVVIGGVTFSYAAGNIASGAVTSGVVVSGANAPWGGALISSIIGSGTTTGVASISATSFAPGATTVSLTSPAPQTSQIGYFGYGFVPAAGGGVLGAAVPTGAQYSTAISFKAGNGGVPGASGTAKPDANGAFFATAVLGNTPWSSAATPTVAASYTQTITQASVAPANILSPSFGIIAWISTIYSPLPLPVDYTSSTVSITAYGFSASEPLTATIGGAAMVSGGTCTTTAFGTCSTVAGKVPDIAGGLQSAAVTGSLSGVVVTSAGALYYNPITDFTSGQTLSINSGGAGQTSVIRTGVGYGVHGLLANTAYNIVWNAISGSQIVGTFTSTATGGVPIPGTQFSVPSDSSGIHILDIETAAGASAIFGNLVLGQTTPTEAPFSGTDTTAYGDLLFNNIALLQAAPSVAFVGQPETISGSGLTAGGAYVIALGTSPTNVNTNSPALATFTATSSGNVPSGITITLADTATKLETGTVEYFAIQTDAHYGVSTTPDAYAQFVLAANAKLNMTTAPTSHPVVITAHGLNAGGAVYDIVFNYVQSAFVSTSYTGTTVGVIAPNSVGAGSATFNVPGTAATGPTTIELVVSTQGTNGAPVGTAVLDTALTLTVGSVSSTSCNSTSCVSAVGSPTQTTQGAYTGVSTSFTNNSNAPITGFVYAVVHNALGQTVDISTATITAPAGGSVSAFNALFGLAPGTYSVTIFVTSSSGTAISTTSTASVTIG
jgi:hypothetical protein